ncbi:MAG: nuclear transport factor 2 family protein [Xanthomonadales bacterium]|nr:nuclear transport factor 2 family protein [Xanthomonadales bacterium]
MQQIRGFQRIGRLVCMALLLVLAGCSRGDPEQAVRAQLEVLQQAIDARDAGAVADLLAEDFIGNDGLDRRGAKQLAAGVFLRHREVGARLGPVTVELRGEGEAIARFSVLATGGSGGLLPEQGQVYQVETGWRLQDGDWKLLNASWTPSGI